jgi:hypothetical protein
MEKRELCVCSELKITLALEDTQYLNGHLHLHQHIRLTIQQCSSTSACSVASPAKNLQRLSLAPALLALILASESSKAESHLMETAIVYLSRTYQGIVSLMIKRRKIC